MIYGLLRGYFSLLKFWIILLVCAKAYALPQAITHYCLMILLTISWFHILLIYFSFSAGMITTIEHSFNDGYIVARNLLNFVTNMFFSNQFNIKWVFWEIAIIS